MSTTASSLVTRGQSLFARSADPVSTQARGFSWGRYALRGLGTVDGVVMSFTEGVPGENATATKTGMLKTTPSPSQSQNTGASPR